ncbi:MAG: DJ-1 family glyoxalase III [Petrimonas sp.]|jgi:4-methyl-5(b-hydroxyethyl)-thiazole monophosphate biosynthesis|nr:MAG: Chaperone protein YajL [Bacteroidetes bacterium ADurb.BinA174]
MKKVALFLANGFEEIEALGTIDILRRAQIPLKTVSITNDRNVTGAHDITVLADITFSELNFSDVDVLILPGGMPGAKNLNEHEELKKRVKEFAEKGKNVAAICAAPMVLGGLGLLDGKKATCYPGFESELVGAKVTGEKVAVDENIITGKGPGFVFDFALQLVETIAGADIRKEVQNGLLV